MRLKKQLALVIALLALVQNVAFAASSTTPPSTHFFTNSWKRMDESQFYQSSCKVTFSGVKGDSNLTDEGNASVELLKAVGKIYKDTIENVFIGKDKKLKTVLSRINIIDKIGAAQTAEDISAALKDPGKKMMTLMLSNEAIYYNYNGGSGNTTGWKTFSDSSTAAKVMSSASEENITYPFNMYSFKFAKWIQSGKNRNAIFNGAKTVEATKNMVEFFVGDGTGYTYDLAQTKLTVDERTGDWLKAESIVTVKSVNPAYQIKVKESCTFNFKSKVKVNLPKNAEPVSDTNAGLQEMGTHVSEF